MQQVDRQAGDDSVRRFAFYFQTLRQNVDRLVVYLDNLESLLVAPRGVESGARGGRERGGGRRVVRGLAE